MERQNVVCLTHDFVYIYIYILYNIYIYIYLLGRLLKVTFFGASNDQMMFLSTGFL